ncbi:MAG: cytochrome c [Planctomycetota bacterium]|nr:cytochrome c [Planctomycetota bacterium]
MNLTRTNIVLGVLLLMTSLFSVAMDVDYTQPNVEFLPDMKRSAASDAYAENANLPDGRTLQAPVRGTISRGDLPLYYSPSKEDAVRAGEELDNPYTISDAADPGVNSDGGQPGDSPDADRAAADGQEQQDAQAGQAASKSDPKAKLNASIQRGAAVYGVFCVSCHGPSGAGDGPVAKRGFPPPPPLPAGKSAKMKDGQLFHILTYGQGSMAPMAAQLTRDRRWDVINYVRGLQTTAPPGEIEAGPPSERAAGMPETSDAPSSEKDPQP